MSPFLAVVVIFTSFAVGAAVAGTVLVSAAAGTDDAGASVVASAAFVIATFTVIAAVLVRCC